MRSVHDVLAGEGGGGNGGVGMTVPGAGLESSTPHCPGADRRRFLLSLACAARRSALSRHNTCPRCRGNPDTFLVLTRFSTCLIFAVSLNPNRGITEMMRILRATTPAAAPPRVSSERISYLTTRVVLESTFSTITKLMWRVCVAVLLVTSISSPAWAIEPITDALLDKADKEAKDVIQRAEAAGNAIAKEAGEQARKAIEALRKAVHDSIGETKEAVLSAQWAIFNNINSLIDKANNSEKVLVTDVTTLTATLSNQIKNLPWTNHAPEVMLHQPRVIVPKGPPVIAFRVIGPRLAASNPEVTFDGKPIPVDKAGDVELIARLDRSQLPFDSMKPKYVAVKITYDRQKKLFNPKSWFSDRDERNMTVLLLPEILGTYILEPRIKSTTTETKKFLKRVGGHGKDSPMDFTITPDPLDIEAGWEIDADQIVKNKSVVAFVSGPGHDAKCVGLVAGTLTRESFTFRIQHHHATDIFGHKSDGDRSCTMTVPLIKKTPTTVPGDDIKGEIGWIKEVKKDLPRDLASYDLTLSLFDGKEPILTQDSNPPFGVVEIERGKNYVIFRPKPPVDF
jgi:hypothetical protein